MGPSIFLQSSDEEEEQDFDVGISNALSNDILHKYSRQWFREKSYYHHEMLYISGKLLIFLQDNFERIMWVRNSRQRWQEALDGAEDRISVE